MDIYIKNMKMPTNCDDCLLGCDCPHDQSIDGYKMQGGRPRTCPLVPAADVRPVVRGKWIDDKGDLVPWDELNKNCPNDSAFCSVCGEWLTASDEYPVIGNFCPNCGAWMEES